MAINIYCSFSDVIMLGTVYTFRNLLDICTRKLILLQDAK